MIEGIRHQETRAKMMLPTRVKCGLVTTLITCASLGRFTQISSVAERRFSACLNPFIPPSRGITHFSFTIITQALKIRNHILTCADWLLLGDHCCGLGLALQLSLRSETGSRGAQGS